MRSTAKALAFRLLGASACCALVCTACGGTEDQDPGLDAGPAAAQHAVGGFSTVLSSPEQDAGAWDFGAMPDSMAGQICDPAIENACGTGLMCCSAGRTEKRCTAPIRTGECPLMPSGPSGGHSSGGSWQAPRQGL